MSSASDRYNFPVIFAADDRGFVTRVPINDGEAEKSVFSFSFEKREDGPITLDQMPPEILTEILLLVDHVDLFENCPLVCKRFYALISSPEFCLARFEPDLGRAAIRSLVSSRPANPSLISLDDLKQSFGRNLFKSSKIVSHKWQSVNLNYLHP